MSQVRLACERLQMQQPIASHPNGSLADRRQTADGKEGPRRQERDGCVRPARESGVCEGSCRRAEASVRRRWSGRREHHRNSGRPSRSHPGAADRERVDGERLTASTTAEQSAPFSIHARHSRDTTPFSHQSKGRITNDQSHHATDVCQGLGHRGCRGNRARMPTAALQRVAVATETMRCDRSSADPAIDAQPVNNVGLWA